MGGEKGRERRNYGQGPIEGKADRDRVRERGQTGGELGWMGGGEQMRNRANRKREQHELTTQTGERQER